MRELDRETAGLYQQAALTAHAGDAKRKASGLVLNYSSDLMLQMQSKPASLEDLGRRVY